MKAVFKVDGGGDMSVGIPDTHATITIEDNYKDVDKDQMELFREFLREWYDIPKHMGSILTFEEWEKQQAEEDKYYEEMKKEYDEEMKEDNEEE